MTEKAQVKRKRTGFWQQLRLLLWKNFTLKRRSPVVFSLEVFIPLVLFIILVLIRRSEEPRRVGISTFSPMALPSAGLVPVFQSFCHGEDEEVFNGTNDRLTSVLETIQHIVELGLYDESLRNGSLKELPEKMKRKATEMRGNTKHNTSSSTRYPLKRLFFNETAMAYLLENVLKIPTALSAQLFNSTFDLTEIFRGLADAMKNNASSSIILALMQDDGVHADLIDKTAELDDLLCRPEIGNISSLDGNVMSEANREFCRLPAEERTLGLQSLIQGTNLTFLQDELLTNLLNQFKIVHTEVNKSDILGIFRTAVIVSRTLPDQKCNQDHMHLDQKSSDVQVNFTKKYGDLLDFWSMMRPVLCSQENKYKNSTEKTHTEGEELSPSQKKHLSVLTRLLYGNPKILFSPNNTAANGIIQKVNETFVFYGNITSFARQWLNISDEIRQTTSSISNMYGAFFTPLYDAADKIACAWLSVFDGIDLNVLKGFSSEAELEAYFLNQQFHDNISVVAGLVFENLNDSTKELPPHVRYKIRQNATFNPTTRVVRNKLWFPSPGTYDLKYYYFGFVWIQDLVERAIIESQADRLVIDPGLFLHRMPYPCWLWGHFIWLIQHIVPLCFMLSWVYPVAMLVQRIVYEKEQRLKEVMKMMGLSNGVHWCAWFISSVIQMTITMVILTVMMHYGKILPYSNPAIVFLYLEMFALSSIAFSFLISSCFSKAKLAAACAGIFYFLTYIPYIYISIKEDLSESGIVDASIKTAVSLFSTTALGLGGKYFLYYELEGVGCQWDNVMISPREHDRFSLFLVLLMMIIDSFLYFTLAWYIENVHPGTYGLPKPWFFPFTKSYWCQDYTETSAYSLKQLFGAKKKSEYLFLDDADEDTSERYKGCESYFEKEPDLQVGVSIKDLTKIFDPSKPPALSKLNLPLYEGQITSFLGHNGAGKTTTMSLLTGLFPATSGEAIIYGYSISRDMDVIRQNLGICPQHNVLFDKLSVEEHLWFYARLKGKESEEIALEMKVVLKDINLTEKRKYIPNCLSGGMRRKLSVALAFVGGSKTVILDEPTSGVDPYSRRSIWDLLVKYKKDRTILLSTHHMDEAETLGDRIAVLSHGHLKCCGTPGFLKSSLGQGLHLYILRSNETDVQENSNCIEDSSNSRRILENVQKFFPLASIKSESACEIHILLPLINRQKEMCIKLFEELEREKQTLKVESYGITDSTLEEVFVKVMEDEPRDTKEILQSSCKTQRTDRHMELGSIRNENVSGQDQTREIDFMQLKGNFACWANLFRAMASKRFCYTKRNRKGLISQILLPAVFVSIAMTVALSAPSFSDLPPLIMDPSQYYSVTQPRGNFIPYDNRQPSAKYNSSRKDAGPAQILKTFHLPSGIGATCVLRTPYNGSFDRDAILDLKSHPHRFKLVSKYFNKECYNVFQSGISLDNYTPYADTTHNISWFGNTTQKAHKYYPLCRCKDDGVGFMCSDGGFERPPELEVVTRAKLQDITGTNEHNFFLFTNDEYRLHRYGGLSVGVTLPYIPKSFYTNKRTRSIMKMVAVGENAHIWFNQKGYHSMPVYTNALNNAILRANLPKNKGNPAAYGITLINHPMKHTNDLKDSDYMQGGTDVIMAIFIIIAMSFVPASFAVFLVHERKIKAKHLQFISGVNPVIYWLSNYLWDMCNYVIPTVCILAVLLAFDIPAYTASGNFQAVMALFILYGWAITPMMYPFTFIFHEPSVAYIFLIVINLFTGITSIQGAFMLDLFSDNETITGVRKIVGEIFLIFPNYCLGNSLMEIALNHYKNDFYSHTGQYELMVKPMIWRLTVKKLVVMSISGLVMLIFTMLCEYRFFIRKRISRPEPEIASLGDDDVQAERQRTLNGTGRNDLLRIENVSKVYRTRKLGKIRAVDNLTLAIPEGECFGLLGVNGAGKTSLFKMLTGDIQPTSGDCFLNNISVLKNPGQFYKQIGYCPQFDSLFDELTPTEQLHLYARLKCVKLKHEEKVVNWALQKLSLCPYKDQRTGTLSGGNKRKLSTAISLIGNPKVILMDEPTSGMDPYSRRFLWDTIGNLTREGKSVLFTSHSMEECETLCSRLSIMVNGQMKCLGSIQHLKNKYGDGYTISVTLKSLDKSNSVQQYVEQNIHGCVLCDKRYRTLTFEVKSLDKGLAYLFKVLEDLLLSQDVEDYSVSQNTLDNVFINFSKQQKELAKDIDEVHLETDEETATSPTTLQDAYDEPLILLTPRNAVNSTRSYDSDEEILIA